MPALETNRTIALALMGGGFLFPPLHWIGAVVAMILFRQSGYIYILAAMIHVYTLLLSIFYFYMFATSILTLDFSLLATSYAMAMTISVAAVNACASQLSHGNAAATTGRAWLLAGTVLGIGSLGYMFPVTIVCYGVAIVQFFKIAPPQTSGFRVATIGVLVMLAAFTAFLWSMRLSAPYSCTVLGIPGLQWRSSYRGSRTDCSGDSFYTVAFSAHVIGWAMVSIVLVPFVWRLDQKLRAAIEGPVIKTVPANEAYRYNRAANSQNRNNNNINNNNRAPSQITANCGACNAPINYVPTGVKTRVQCHNCSAILEFEQR